MLNLRNGMGMVLIGSLGLAGCPGKSTPPAGDATAQGADTETVLQEYKKQLSEAGDRGQCDQAKESVRAAMAKDARLSDAAIQAEIDHYEKVKGPMPYPSPGTACAIFGFQDVARGALQDRRSK